MTDPNAAWYPVASKIWFFAVSKGYLGANAVNAHGYEQAILAARRESTRVSDVAFLLGRPAQCGSANGMTCGY